MNTFCAISDGTTTIPLTEDFRKQSGTTYYKVCSHDYGTSYRTIIAQILTFDGQDWNASLDTERIPVDVRRDMGALFRDHNPKAWEGSPPGFRNYFGV